MGTLFLFLALFFGNTKTNQVKYLCKYPLDEHSWVETDMHLQGIWKLRQDTNYNNYFVVERDGTYQLNIT